MHGQQNVKICYSFCFGQELTVVVWGQPTVRHVLCGRHKNWSALGRRGGRNLSLRFSLKISVELYLL